MNIEVYCIDETKTITISNINTQNTTEMTFPEKKNRKFPMKCKKKKSDRETYELQPEIKSEFKKKKVIFK